MYIMTNDFIFNDLLKKIQFPIPVHIGFPVQFDFLILTSWDKDALTVWYVSMYIANNISND